MPSSDRYKHQWCMHIHAGWQTNKISKSKRTRAGSQKLFSELHISITAHALQPISPINEKIEQT